MEVSNTADGGLTQAYFLGKKRTKDMKRVSTYRPKKRMTVIETKYSILRTGLSTELSKRFNDLMMNTIATFI